MFIYREYVKEKKRRYGERVEGRGGEGETERKGAAEKIKIKDISKQS
jgi:hypothetical protein